MSNLRRVLRKLLSLILFSIAAFFMVISLLLIKLPTRMTESQLEYFFRHLTIIVVSLTGGILALREFFT